MKKIKIGFMPLYIKLYDDINLNVRGRLDEFYEKLAVAFEEGGFDVVRNPFCRIKPEFEACIANSRKRTATVS